MRKFRPELIERESGGWYVSNGDQSVGPVALELLVRGVESGRVPAESFVRHEAWKVWRPLTELTTIAETVAEPADDEGPATIRESSPTVGMPIAPAVAAQQALAAGSLAEGRFPPPLRAADARAADECDTSDEPIVDLAATFEALALQHGLPSIGVVETFDAADHTDVTNGLENRPPSDARRASVRPSTAPAAAPGPGARSSASRRPIAPIGGAAGIPTLTDDVASPARPAESADRMEGDELAGATDLREALLLFLGAIVRRVDADGALLHRTDDEGALVAYAHGDCAAEMLGARTRLLDPSLLAASSGHAIIAEPVPGAGGAVLLARLRGVVGGPPAPGGAGMLPIIASGRLRAFVEIGRRRPFTMRDWAEAEKLVTSLVARIHAQGW
jgi:hypothetical protein